jgi:hypothetical protein
VSAQIFKLNENMEDLERYLLTESNSRTNSKDRGFRPWDQGDMETNRDITLGITLGGYAVLCSKFSRFSLFAFRFCDIQYRHPTYIRHTSDIHPTLHPTSRFEVPTVINTTLMNLFELGLFLTLLCSHSHLPLQEHCPSSKSSRLEDGLCVQAGL